MNTLAMTQRIMQPGFIAALDQSGGSSPKALADYGIDASAWGEDTEQMFNLIHEMRTRVIVNPVFNERIVGAILFERTMESNIEGVPTAQYLWEQKQVVPFLKIDEGLEQEADGVQLMKPMIGLDARLKSAVSCGIFGTKMRSVIHSANPAGIAAIVTQQFAAAAKIYAAGLMPIIEPEISINAPSKAAAEVLLKQELLKGLSTLPIGQKVMLKLTLPEEPNFYKELVMHPNVLRVVALSGGYSRDVANAKLANNHGVIASFSRALMQDLRINQTDAEFTTALDAAIESIYQASIA